MYYFDTAWVRGESRIPQMNQGKPNQVETEALVEMTAMQSGLITMKGMCELWEWNDVCLQCSGEFVSRLLQKLLTMSALEPTLRNIIRLVVSRDLC